MILLDPPRRARKPGLTPMIDVVFLLLVFFMLAARFGPDHVIPLATSGAGPAYDGPPRLVGIGSDSLRLNGNPVAAPSLAADLAALMLSPRDPVILRPDPTAQVQDLVEVIDLLRSAGMLRLIVVE